MDSLGGQRALVTGAGRRLGRAIALALGAAGARVAVHYHESQAGADETCRLIRDAGGEAIALPADLTDRDQARTLVDRSVSELGGLDLLVASAASFERIAYDELDDAAFDRSLALNLATPLALAQRASPALRQAHGSIVFITCSSATVPFRNYLPYVVSKGALRHLMRTLALELAPAVRVNAVAPGTVLPAEDMSEASVGRLADRIPLGRIGSPDDVARAVIYLATARFVTGHELVVDGGRTVAGFERYS
ncbi:MAG TPA: SDR family oxidoreductase [Polyangiaceae bacterium]|jgi:pteridine reductase|nr:SDR family oxidoreductase [Polyangiaceae bacterium]